ncbi:MAG: CoB--CoM heterodisulfide reductase iron-sulfur subunit A family protein [Chlorobi bacterium]|nr:CoB--CoM heterodisulfide reductase iron-sulfur subunit A family protein [Chlorobiota bacterium]
MDKQKFTSDLLVVGAGIAGLTAALETAETGFTVSLIEKMPNIGGRIAQLNQYFPKLCPPSCGLEVNTRKLRENSNVNLLTLAEVVSVEGGPGDYLVKVKVTPRYIKEDVSDTDIEESVDKCAILLKNEFNYGIDKHKAIFPPYNNAFPMKYVFNKAACSENEIKNISASCSDIIDLDQDVEIIDMRVKAIIWATGWTPYNANNLTELGYKGNANVITNVELERLASANGPTGGKIQIAGEDNKIEKIAFVQCAGSRDENHLEFCSSVCCMASLKQARYIREQFPDADIYICYIDIRTPGCYEDFYEESKKDEKLHLKRGKIAKVIKDPDSDQMIVESEDTLGTGLDQIKVDLVVLATGMKPNTDTFPDKSMLDDCGFIKTDNARAIIACGVCAAPLDVSSSVQDATGAAMKAIHIIKEGK